MKGLLLSAGSGTRLLPLTTERPKAMVEIGGEPAIARSLRWIARHRVTDVAINLHHHPEVLRAFVGDGARFGVRVTYSPEERLLGTAGALGTLRAFFKGEDAFVVLYGDVLTSLNLSSVIDLHRARGADATVALDRAVDPAASGIVAFDADGWITRIVEKPPPGEIFSEWANAGIYLCGPKVMDFVPARGPYDFAAELFPRMLGDHCRLLAYPTTSVVAEFGTPDRLERARAAVSRGTLA